MSGPRRDLTPIRMPPKPAPQSAEDARVDLTVEEFSSMVRDAAACLRKTQELSTKVDELGAKVDTLLTTRTQGHVLLAIGRWLIGLVAVGIVGWVSWVYSEQRSHDVRLTRAETQFVGYAETLERHERRQEDLGHVRGDVQAMRGSLEALRHDVDEIRTDVRELRARPRR